MTADVHAMGFCRRLLRTGYFRRVHASPKFLYTAKYSPKAAHILSSLLKKEVTNSLDTI